MQSTKPTIEHIKELVSHFAGSGLGSFTLQDGDFLLRLESDAAAAAHGMASPAPVSAAASAPMAVMPTDSAPKTAPQPEQEPPVPCQPEGTVVTAPVVGTFYRAASPDKPPFVTEGQKVKKGDVLFIIESMKLMNEIQSECDGTVGKILVQDGQGVEFGQPLLTLI